MGKPGFQTILLTHQEIADICVIDTVAVAPGHAYAYLATDTPPESVEAANDTRLENLRSVGNGLIADLHYTSAAPELTLGGTPCQLVPTPAQTDLFDRLNTALAFRNGEPVSAVLDWLRYHVRHHALQAALIVDRARPDEAAKFARKLKKGAKEINGLKQLVHVHSDMPLGQADLPAEAHPFNAPDAPGKDRMDIPEPAPWDAPLGELQLFELMRRRFLDTARAVALLEVSDLLTDITGAGVKGRTVFDAAVKSATGSVVLAGRNCYPWRVRKGDAAAHGDHICVQFDATKLRKRWCVAPSRTGPNTVWRMVRIVSASPEPDEWVQFYRCMGLRHPADSVSKIVPKTSLIEDATLLDMATNVFDHKALRMPEIAAPEMSSDSNDVAIITCMKNEGPFILEWLAYHRAIGVKDVLVYTNDCNDGTDIFLQLLQKKGYVQHRENPFEGTGLKPQHAALQAGEKEEVIKYADWVISMDVDEFINIKVGDGTVTALFDAVPDANLISCTWRLFGNSDVHEYTDDPLMAQFTRCAPEITRKPHQAWGFKTLFRNVGLFKKLGVHRPKGLNPQLWNEINWVNGSGAPLPKDMYRNAWRSTSSTVGYDMVQLNHYAVRSAESFLVKRDRGRVNHVDRDQGLAYWFRMNNNVDQDTSIQRMIPAMQAEKDRLLSDPEIAEAHAFSVDRHRAKIDALKETDNYASFYKELTGHRMQRLARLHPHFGANVFLAGPEVIPDWLTERELPDDFFFTVDKQETAH
ncbi:glycosyltransferase family 2 protein [Shimia abyssi]|uniref:Glycosyl transferase family 2 n=1 Tax=Shimia abyssi TaxID=1662395 RepID=A0A2P8FBM7_9RHOB|nr:glycosyltransferase family 2 protein [Shimia abyssi]PSL19147.1 glycosyl transferase family 2 [Shimia abyssi]